MTKLKLPIRDLTLLKTLIPHREPMIMVDALINHTTEGSTSELTILDDMLFVEQDIFIESGILEHMAQTAALHTGFKWAMGDSKPRLGYIASIQYAEFFDRPKVSDTLTSELSILFESVEICKFEVKTFVNERFIAKAILTTVLKSI